VSQGITRIIQVSSLIAAAGVRGALRGNSTIGLFEVDEATVPLVVEAIGATDIVVTNLFRDQLDRFGEVDAIATTVGKAIQRTNARVYLNADDPTVASLSRFVGPGRLVYFGLESPAAGVAALKTAVDSVHCPRCDATLRFSRTFYSHLGHYECPRGDFARPGTTVAVSSIERADAGGSAFTVQMPGHRYRAEMSGVDLAGGDLRGAEAVIGVGSGMWYRGRALGVGHCRCLPWAAGVRRRPANSTSSQAPPMSQLPRTSPKKWTPRISRLNPTAAASRTAPADSGTFHRADTAGSSKSSATPITTIELSVWPLGKEYPLA